MFEVDLADIKFANSITDLWDYISKWSQETFGPDNQRGPEGPLKHLAKEANEAATEENDAKRLTELADCLIVLMDAARRNGTTLPILIAAAHVKMDVNRSRMWPKLTNENRNEPIEHIRTEDE